MMFVCLLSLVTESHSGGKEAIKASLTSHVSNWMPSSEAATLSDLSALIVLRGVTQRKLALQRYPPRLPFPKWPRLISASRRSSLLPCALLKIHLSYPGAFKSSCSVAIFDLLKSVSRFPRN